MGRQKTGNPERIVGARQGTIPTAVAPNPAKPNKMARARKVLFDPRTLRAVNETLALFSAKWGPIDWPKATRALWWVLRMDGRTLLALPTTDTPHLAPSRTERAQVLEHEAGLLEWLHTVLEIPRPHREDRYIPPDAPRNKGKNYGLTAREIEMETKMLEAIRSRWGEVDKSHVTRVMWMLVLSARRRIEYMEPAEGHRERQIPFGTRTLEISIYIRAFAQWLHDDVLHRKHRQPASARTRARPEHP